MIFNSKKIVYSLEENWDELVNITFVSDNSYLSLSSLAYEDEVGIEFNDQVNYKTVLKNDCKIKQSETVIHVTVENIITQNNLPDSEFIISFQDNDLEKLRRALNALLKE